MSTGLSRYPESLVEAHAEELHGGFYTLMENPKFREAISLGTNQVARVSSRFELTRKMLEEVFGD
ncbi:hypothetical protein D3C77_623940 [compost metagenome]